MLVRDLIDMLGVTAAERYDCLAVLYTHSEDESLPDAVAVSFHRWPWLARRAVETLRMIGVPYVALGWMDMRS